MLDDLKRRLADTDRQLKKHLEHFENLLMKKKLKIKFWKAEKALVMQILEQEGLPKCKQANSNSLIRITSMPSLFYETGEVYLRGQDTNWDYGIASIRCESNTRRDAYLNKAVNAITDELFTSGGELKVGEMCEVASCPDLHDGYWHRKKLIAILPDNYRSRFITQSDEDSNNWFGYKYARPLCKRTEPKVETNGEIVTYTWEEE